MRELYTKSRVQIKTEYKGCREENKAIEEREVIWGERRMVVEIRASVLVGLQVLLKRHFVELVVFLPFYDKLGWLSWLERRSHTVV